MKRITISIPCSNEDSIAFLIRAGVTAGQVLKQLAAPDHILYALPMADHSVFRFDEDDELYPELLDGHFLWAIPTNLSSDALLNLCIYGSVEPPLDIEEARRELCKFVEDEEPD